jgi:hypothetical protein
VQTLYSMYVRKIGIGIEKLVEMYNNLFVIRISPRRVSYDGLCSISATDFLLCFVRAVCCCCCVMTLLSHRFKAAYFLY